MTKVIKLTSFYVAGIADKLKESMLNNVCKSAILSSEYPRTSISIIVQEMQSSGTVSNID